MASQRTQLLVNLILSTAALVVLLAAVLVLLEDPSPVLRAAPNP